MTFARLANYFSYLVLFGAYTLTGLTASMHAAFWIQQTKLNLPGKRLPAVTDFIFALDGSNRATPMGIILGATFALILLFLEHKPQTRSWTTSVMTLAWALCVLHLLAFVWAVGLIAVPSSIYVITPGH